VYDTGPTDTVEVASQRLPGQHNGREGQAPQKVNNVATAVERARSV
jgi:hypothetical protein